MKTYTLIILNAVLLYSCNSQEYARNYLTAYENNDSVEIRRHFDSINFYFGSIANSNDLHNYEFINSFNSITLENGHKWGSLLKNGEVGNYDFSAADSIVNEALKNNCRVRGHTLIWGSLSDRFKSPDLEEYLKRFPENERKQVLYNLIKHHIDTVLVHFKGRVMEWDVVNEPLGMMRGKDYDKTIFYRYFGEDYVPMCFKLAHQADPTIRLFLNEQLHNYTETKAYKLLDLINELKANDIPIQGVGLQSHVMFSVPEIADVKKYLDTLALLGLDIELTEVDARLRLFRKEADPYEAQARFYMQLLNICIENKKCKGFTFWGYSDKDVWYDRHMSWMFRKPNEPYLFDAEMNPKPLYFLISNTFSK